MKYKKAYQKFIAMIVASLLVCLFVVPEDISTAKDSFASEFIQTVYNQSNGIGSNEVKCLYQSSSGYIWIGTESGLYRTNGAEFQSINLWDTDRSDVYSINCIMQDSEGRVWIGTDNYGLFYIEKGETHHLQDEYYDGIKSISGVCQLDTGEIYVSTLEGLYQVVLGDAGATLQEHPESRVSGRRLKNLVCFEGKIWVQAGGQDIYILDNDGLLDIIDTSEVCDDDIQSIEVMQGKVYVGTSGNEVIVYRNKSIKRTIVSSVDGINGFMMDLTSRVWVCADNGVGYFDNTDTFHRINELEIDSYISDMLMDYEGNYWFASNKMGVLLLSRSKFSDFNLKSGMPETIVNCVYASGNEKYIATDDGIYIYDGDNNKIDNELSDKLSGTGVRYICKDSSGNLWIATSRRFGVVRVGTDDSILSITRNDGLPSMEVNYIVELDNRNIAIATEEGVAICDKSGKIQKTYGSEEGLSDVYINCMYQNDDGLLMLGTDGDGMIAIDLDTDEMTTYGTNDGLNSDVITSFAEGDEGLYIGTDNGLCFYNEAFRGISSIDYSNSIYDILIYEDNVWVIGSKGIICASEDELLGNQSTANRYFDKNDGLRKSLNTIGKSDIDSNGIMYICCDTGLYTLNINNIPYNNVAPRISVTSVDVDGKKYEFGDLADGLEIDNKASRITVKFAVFSYSNRDNIQVEYYLEGFDETPIIISGSDSLEAVYTNLEGGTYRFTISAINGDGVTSSSSVSFVIEKKKSLFEKSTARLIFLVLLVVSVILVIYAALKVRKLLKSKNTALEKLSRQHEEAVKSSSAKTDYLANMSNEIKAPINVMMVKAEELLNMLEEDTPYRKDIEDIYSTGSGIIDKVDDIILLAKIEAGRIEVINQPYSVADIMYDISEFAKDKIGNKTIKFFVEISEEIGENIIGDADKIKDIVKRLVDNAVKFTREGSITLSVDCYEYTDKNHQDMMNLVFTVSDTGTGIQEDRLQDIFRMYNIDENRKSSYNAGNGIGLAIAKGYADLIDGELQAESVYGAGSTFTLSVNQRTVENTRRSRVISKIDETVSKEDADKLWLPDVSMLIVDDDEQNLDITKKLLSKFEMKIDEASSGINAIDMIMNNNYDVVLMDLSMPIMNGTDTMKEIREIEGEGFDILPIISMDTDAIDKNRDKLLEAGFTDTLVKPIDIRRAAAILKDCLPQSKIQEKTSNISEYIQGSRYRDGLLSLEDVVDVENTIEKIGGSIDVFNRLMVTFYNQNYKAPEDIREKFPKDIRGFKSKIHSIKTGSANIGAHKISQEATRIEAATNIGNKEYTRDKLDSFLADLEELLQYVADYVNYIDELSGMTDEEYAEKNSMSHTEEEKKIAGEELDATDSVQIDMTDIGTVDIDMLEDIKYAALDGDFKMAEEYLDILMGTEYVGENKEFMEVLVKAVSEKNVSDIEQLVTTYIDLKL